MNELGAGFLESAYEKALLVALRKQGLRAEYQAPISVVFRGEVAGESYADLLVGDKVIIELKTARALSPEHHAQGID